MSLSDTSQPSLAAANTASTIRNILATLGGVAVTHGALTSDQNGQVQIIVGALLVLVPAIWSFVKNWNIQKRLTAGA